MGEGAIAGLVVRVDRWGGKEPVRVVGVSADAQGHLVNYSAPLWVGQTITVLNQRGRGRQDGLGGVMSSSEGASGLVGKQRVGGQALGVRGGGGRSVCRAAVRQVGKSVCVDRGGDVGVGPQGPVVAVPIFVGVVGQEELHLGQRTSRSPQIPTDPNRSPPPKRVIGNASQHTPTCPNPSECSCCPPTFCCRGRWGAEAKRGTEEGTPCCPGRLQRPLDWDQEAEAVAHTRQRRVEARKPFNHLLLWLKHRQHSTKSTPRIRSGTNLRSAHKGNFCYWSNFNGDNAAAATPKEMHPLFSPFRNQQSI